MQLAAFLESEMKVKAMYSLQNGKLTSGAPQLDTFLPPQLQQLVGEPSKPALIAGTSSTQRHFVTRFMYRQYAALPSVLHAYFGLMVTS